MRQNPLLPALAALTVSFGLTVAAAAETPRGTFTYKSQRECQQAGKLGSDICRHAAQNAEAEFDEKSPRFSTRGLCEAQFGRAGCSLSIASAAGYAGKREGIYFLPRQDGFRVTVRSSSDITVVPLARRGGGYRPRTALRPQTERSRQVRIQTERARAAASARNAEEPMIDLPPLEGPDPADAGFVPSGAAAPAVSPAEAERRRQKLDAAPFIP